MTRAPCRAGDTKRVMQLLAGDGGAQLNEKDKNGDITKMWVSRQGAQVENGWTALLWWASLKGHTEVVRLLLVLCAILALETRALVGLVLLLMHVGGRLADSG